jgi:hypothetical protein
MASAAGYSGTPLVKKLGIAEGTRVVALDAPAGFARTLGALPRGATLGQRPAAAAVTIAFVTRRADLERRVAAVRARMPDDGALWIAWPKRASGVVTDVTEDVVRAVALPTGLVDNKVCAIDETWSGLRLVIRRALRGGA